jgi:ATP-dependent DNA helicase RecG
MLRGADTEGGGAGVGVEDMNDILNVLLNSNENEHVEFKEAKNTYNETLLCDYVAAIANEKGGKFVLGITDKKPRKIVGTHAFANIEKIKKKLLDVTSLKVDVDEILSPAGRVLIFNIPSRPIGFPIRSHGNYKARSGESLIEMPQEMLKQIFDEGGLDFSAEICPNAMIDDLDKKAIEEFRKRWLKKSGNERIISLSIEQLLSDTELMIINLHTLP